MKGHELHKKVPAYLAGGGGGWVSHEDTKIVSRSKWPLQGYDGRIIGLLSKE